MIDQVARALDELSRREWFVGDDDLVFCNGIGETSTTRRFGGGSTPHACAPASSGFGSALETAAGPAEPALPDQAATS
jgi:hypothetical protein